MTAYFTGLTSEDRCFCIRPNITLISVVNLEGVFLSFFTQKHIQVSLNTALFKNNKIRMLQICNYSSEPQHNGQVNELSLNLKPSVV